MTTPACLLPFDPERDCLPGDVVLDHGSTALAKAIQACQTALDGPDAVDGEAFMNHAKMVVDCTGMIVEALESVVIRPWRKSAAGVVESQIWRLRTLNRDQREAIAKAAVEFTGASYAWWELALLGLDAGLSRLTRKPVFFFQRRLKVRSRVICSQLVATAYDAVLGPAVFGRPADQITPDEIHDHVRNARQWECVHVYLRRDHV